MLLLEDKDGLSLVSSDDLSIYLLGGLVVAFWTALLLPFGSGVGSSRQFSASGELWLVGWWIVQRAVPSNVAGRHAAGR